MDYIIDFKPHKEEMINTNYYADIESKISTGKSITQTEAENFLGMVNYLIRTKVSPSFTNFENTCDLAQSILGYYLDSINCKVAHCSTQKVIAPKVEGHNFSVVSLNVEGEEKDYLLDPTYIQFFTKEKCNKERYVVSTRNPNLVLLTPAPGFFIKEEDMDAANFLLKYGYIELTPEYAKIYGDSFYNTDRGVKLAPKEFLELPGSMYLRSFKTGTEQLSLSKELLLANNQLITNFQYLDVTKAKVG